MYIVHKLSRLLSLTHYFSYPFAVSSSSELESYRHVGDIMTFDFSELQILEHAQEHAWYTNYKLMT